MSDPSLRPRPFAVAPVFLLVGVVFLTFVGRLIFSPLLPSIERDLGITHAQAGSFFFFIAAGFSPTMLLSGFVAARLNHRRTIVLSASLVGLGAAGVALSPSLLAVQLSLLVLGSGAGLYPPSGIAALTDMVESHHWGKALALHDLGPNIAFVLTPLLATLALQLGGWRSAMVGIAVVSFAVAALFAARSRAGAFHGEPPHLRNIVAIFRVPTFWAIGTFFVLASAATFGVFSIVPTFLVAEHGYSESFVNSVVSASRLSGIAIVLVAGWLRDRFGERLLIGVIMAATGLLTIAIGLTQGGVLLAVIVVQPMIIPAFFTVAIAALSGIGPPEIRNVAVSLTVPSANVLGTGVYPALMGILGEAGLFHLGFITLGAIMLLVLPLLRLFPRAARDGEA